MKLVSVSDMAVEQWNAFVAQAPSFALMQSYEWGGVKERLGWKTVRLAVLRQGQTVAAAQLLIKHAPLRLFSFGYVPRGPLVDWEDEVATRVLLDALHSEAQRHKAVFVKIEPPLLNNSGTHRQLLRLGFRASSYTNQPRATIQVDLTRDLDDILKQMRKQTRRDIRRAVREGVTVRMGDCEDLPAFCDLMRVTGRRSGFSSLIPEYYEQEGQAFADNEQAALLMAFYHDRLLAVQMVFRLGEHAAFFHEGSSGECADLGSNHLLVWEAIKWAKAQGCRTYDLWGIPDEVGQAVFDGKEPPRSDRTDGLWGVYRFKSGFSKKIVYYIGAYDYVYLPPLYALMKLVNKDRLDRIAVWMDFLRRT